MNRSPLAAATRALFAAIAAFAGLSLAVVPAHADEEVPYWASLRAEEANMRVGPSEAYPIEWVYQRVGLPLKVVRRMSGWRLVEDPDGARGWIVSRFLSLERTAIVTGEGPAPIRARPDAGSALLWRAEPGVSGDLGECRDGWCRFAVGEKAGWMAQDRLWGAGEP